MLDVPEHNRRRIPLRSGQEYGGAGNARNVFGLNLLHEFRDRSQRFMHSSHHGRRAAMPDPHDAIDQDGQDQRDISAFGDLGEIGDEEGTVDDEKEGRASARTTGWSFVSAQGQYA